MTKGGRAFATRAHPLMLANALLLYIPLCLAMGVAARKKYYYAGGFVMFLTLLLTYSRGPFIYLSVVSLIALIFSFKRFRIFFLIMVISVAAALGIIKFSRGLPAQARLNFKIPGRMILWKASGHMIYDYPLFGTGAGNAMAIYEKSYDISRAKFYHFHNNFIQIMIERGIFSLAAYVYFLYALFKGIFARIKSDSGGNKIIWAGFLASFFAFTLASLTDFTFYRPEMYLPFYFLLGLVSSPVFLVQMKKPIHGIKNVK